MRALRVCAILAAALLTSLGFGQAWMSSYEAGLKAARQNQWTQARDAFKQAAANRADDVSGPTNLPGSPTEQRRWRKGSPYSPNFLAAYSEYRAGLDVKDASDRATMLRTAAGEFETLLAKNQQSRDTYFFLDRVYSQLGNESKRQDLANRFQQASGHLTWKVDEEPIAPQELAAITDQTGGTGATPVQPGTPISAAQLTSPVVGLGAVPILGNKYALIVGQSSSHLEGGLVPYAQNDAERVRDALVSFAGYDPANVTTLANVSAAQIMDAAKAIAAKVPEDGVVFIYFAGAGVNINGKDYLGGADTESPTDTASMVPKGDLYSVFVARGARVFAFFEVSRPISNDGYFGAEVPLVGSIAQAQSTRPGEGITPVVHDGRQQGIYAKAFTEVLANYRTNRVPVQDFCWQVYYQIKGGRTGGGGINQTPTLAVLVNMASDARF